MALGWFTPSSTSAPRNSDIDQIQSAKPDDLSALTHSNTFAVSDIDKIQNEKLDGLSALTSSNTSAGSAHPPSEVKTILGEEDAYKSLGFSFSTKKKWLILTSVFIVQLSMNFNAAIYSTAIPGLSEHFNVSVQYAHYGQAIFLITYAFGCELWAPWSEELGRKWVMQISLGLVNLWQIPCALAPNMATVLAFRALGGLSSAGGSVTLGMVADMWEPNDQQFAITYVVFSSCAGSVIAPIAGGYIGTYLSWQWVFWISLIFGGVAQAIHFFVPETRSSVLLDRHAQHLRKTGQNANVFGPNESRGSFWQRISWKHSMTLMLRPYVMLATEPLVLFLCLLSGFSDALIFTGLDSVGIVMAQWGLSQIAIGLTFIALLVGYVIASISFIPVYRRDRQHLRSGKHFPPERRLWWLLFLVPLEPIGLFVYGWASLGPLHFHQAVPQVMMGLIGIANLAIYQATIDYLVAAYGEYSASATGGNGFCRDLLAGIAAFYARPLFKNIKPGTSWTLPIPSFILCGIGILLCIPVYVFYKYGEWFRTRSPFAQKLATEREERWEKRTNAISDSKPVSRAQSPVREL